jgi:hypothetical protein
MYTKTSTYLNESYGLNIVKIMTMVLGEFDTNEMGLGIATCPTGGVIIVANYNPPGNFVGSYPY